MEGGGGSEPRAAAVPRRRNLVMCAEDTPQSAAACAWALSHIWQDGDVLHLV